MAQGWFAKRIEELASRGDRGGSSCRGGGLGAVVGAASSREGKQVWGSMGAAIKHTFRKRRSWRLCPGIRERGWPRL